MALQAVRIQRAIGSRSPSLAVAVATTMHHLVIGRIVAAHTSPGRPLVWHDSAFAELVG